MNSHQSSNEYDEYEENISLDKQALLNESTSKYDQSLFNRYKKWILGACISTVLAVLAIVLVVDLRKQPANNIPWIENPQTSKISTQVTDKPKNVIMMISDGLGPASVSFARTYYQYVNNKPYDYQMPLDRLHVGQSRTRSASTLVTDSAAGATAFSCNLKTYNGAVGVDPNKKPCGTVLESAKHHHNMLTGLVATSRITHATPASFSAHVQDRDNENSIAKQQIGENPLGRSVDLMFGGGYCHFLPKEASKNGCRYDTRNLLEEAKTIYNWTTVLYNDKHMFDQLPIDESILPVMSLFTPDHMSYEIDRDPKIEPSLSEMTKKALDILYKSTENKQKGFFLMIEGSRIDMAAHSNDASTHVHEILEYQNTIDLVTKYVDQHPDTILISTSDHETGGLSLARQVSKHYPEYLWYPDVLTKVKSSTVRLAKIMKEAVVTKEYIVDTILKENLGITDATTKEIDELLKHKSTKQLDQYLADMVSLRAQLGWSTHGHSGVDVNLYAYGVGSRYLIGSHENIQIGEFITKALDLNLTEMTTILNRNDPQFHVSNLTDEGKLEYNEHLEHYHHEPNNLKHIEL